MRQKRRRRNAKKATAFIVATNCVTVEAGDEETSTAEAEPAEMTLEETEEAESVAAQAEETEAVEAEPDLDLEETEEAKTEKAAVAVAEQEKAKPIETTMASLYTSSVGIDLSSINLDKVKKHHSLYRRQKSEYQRPVQISGQIRQRKKKVRTQRTVILRKERRLKSVFTEWIQATSPRGWKSLKIHKLNGKEREESGSRLKEHASQLWQDSVFQRRTGPAGSRWHRYQENRKLEMENYILAKLRLANKPPALIERVLSALVDTRLGHLSFLVPNFFSIGGVT
jgi:hypothetical protein